MMTSRRALILLNMVPGLGPSLVRGLLDRFPEPERIFEAREKDLQVAARLSAKTAAKILAAPGGIDVDAQMTKARETGVEILTCLDEKYPARLREIHDYPCVLYVRGSVQALQIPSLAVVGSRNASYYGTQTCRKLCRKMALLGFGVVSGLARGIDRCAHEATLEAGGITAAVLGSGLDVMYPAEHEKLADRIAGEGGALVSEFAFGTAPLAYHFPRRNRIISGLSFGVLVAEASRNSGSLITAALALEQNRLVLAVPGKVDSDSHNGTNTLIQAGAKLVMDVQDILDEIPDIARAVLKKTAAAAWARPTPQSSAAKPRTPTVPVSADGGLETAIIGRMDRSDPVHVDTLTGQLTVESPKVLAALMKLELQGLVKSLPGKFYRRNF